jgi:hypothetical protein
MNQTESEETMAKQRTTVSLTHDGKLLFERETLYFEDSNMPQWHVADGIKLENIASVPNLLRLAPRKPGNMKREFKPRFGWIHEFVNRITPPASTTAV